MLSIGAKTRQPPVTPNTVIPVASERCFAKYSLLVTTEVKKRMPPQQPESTHNIIAIYILYNTAVL